MYDSITKRVKHLENATGPGGFVFCMITPVYGTCRPGSMYADPDAAAAAFKEENHLTDADKLIALVKTETRWIGNTETAADYLDNTPPLGYVVRALDR